VHRRAGRRICWAWPIETAGYALAGVVSAVVAQQLSRTAMIFGIGIGVAIGA
jgi:hypothetical protein